MSIKQILAKHMANGGEYNTQDLVQCVRDYNIELDVSNLRSIVNGSITQLINDGVVYVILHPSDPTKCKYAMKTFPALVCDYVM